MDNNSLTEKSVNNVTSSNSELESLMEESKKDSVPKIRIRLRPQLAQSSNDDSKNIICNTSVINNICDKAKLAQPSRVITNLTSEKRCYKTLEDSGGGGGSDNCDSYYYKNNFICHGINLRSRPQRIINKCQNKSDKEKKKFNYISSSQKFEFINKSKIKHIGKRQITGTSMMKTTKNIEKIHKSVINNKLNRKQINRTRNETIMTSINLKEIINQRNFVKLSPEIQWQLVNFLPNCDKPKISSEADSCKCRHYIYNSENCKMPPSLGFSVLNNEFLGKALTKFSLKMGQCDFINIFNSERENLRSRPLQILNDDVLIKSNVDEVKTNKNQKTNYSTGNNINKILEEERSNSSTTTIETVEMNGIGNLDDKTGVDFPDKKHQCNPAENDELILKTEALPNTVGDDNNAANTVDEKKSDFAIITENLPENKNINLEKSYHGLSDLNQPMLINIENDSSSSTLLSNFALELGDTRSSNPAYLDENQRKRGRKRKLFASSNELQIIPIKRSNRSTAGKRPARLDSESPPTSPSIFSIHDKRLNIKYKKCKDQINSTKKSKIKFETGTEQLDNLLKLEIKSSKKPNDSLDSSKHLLSAPDLFSVSSENDLNLLSKPSSYGSNLFNSFSRATLVTNQMHSVQTLSPSWSCTSESTTPSAKSDYGHSLPTKISFNVSNSAPEIQDTNALIESEMKHLQRMPPPRQTLTLASMREKMRAKKLAKEDSRKFTNSNSRKSSTLLSNQRHKKQTINTLLKEEEDFKLMEKMITSSDDLLNNSPESLLEFFMGNNYEFDATAEHCISLNSGNYKSGLPKKSNYKCLTGIKEKINKIPVSSNANHSINKSEESGSKAILEKSVVKDQSKESPIVEKSFNDAISYVLQKLNLSKDNNGALPHNTSGKPSLPNAYLVDSNGLTTALSIIQSLNPGAKVTTQQFYLVNSGPQLILQPNPPLAVAAEKVMASPAQIGFHGKVSLAPKIANHVSFVNHLSNVIKDSPSSNNNSFSGVPINKISYNVSQTSETSIQTPEVTLESHLGSSNKIPPDSSEAKNNFRLSPINQMNAVSQSRNVHLQTISTPHQIGFVQPVQQSLPSLFSPQLRFVQPSLSNSATPNTISFLTSNNGTCNTSIVNANQPPKLLFLCPTVPNNSNLVSPSNVLSQDQKYLLLSKQPDKQTTIQLVSPQGLWQQLNPNMISHQNNVLVMQSQSVNTVYDSTACPNNTFLPSASSINSDFSKNERKSSSSSVDTNAPISVFKDPNLSVTSSTESSSSLIIDSRSINKNEPPYLEMKNVNKIQSAAAAAAAAVEGSMLAPLLNHLYQSVNNNPTFSCSQSIQNGMLVVNDNSKKDEPTSVLLTDKFNNSSFKSDQLDMLQSSQDVNLS